MDVFDFSILRELRKQHHLSIAELSESSGVSTPVISKLERNQTGAELDTLYKLAKGFGISAAELLALAEKKLSQRAESTSHRSGEFEFREVVYGNVRCLYGSAPAGAQLSRPNIHHNDYELCWVLSGKLEVLLPKERCELGPGQSLQFDALLHHTYTALTDCRVVLLHLTKNNRF